MAGGIVHIFRQESPSTQNADRFRILFSAPGDADLEGEPRLLDAERLRVMLSDYGLSARRIDQIFEDLAGSGDTQVPLPERSRVGPEIVRAWFDSIINPLIGAIQKEVELVNRQNWSWQFRPGRLESIRPAPEYLAYRASANLEQLVELYPELEKKVDEHDQSVAQLENAVTRLFELLGRFLELLASIREKPTTSHVIGELNGLQMSRPGLHGPELDTFWSGSLDLLTVWNPDEQLIRLIDLGRHSRAHVIRVGYVDAGVIEMARTQGCPLITQDEGTLAPLAWEIGVDFLLVKQIV